MEDFNKNAFGELVARTGCGFVIVAVLLLVLSLLSKCVI
jgi:hypothetical protein